MRQPDDFLTQTGPSPATRWRAKRRIALALMIIGALPAIPLVLGLFLSLVSPCAFDNGPDYCGDLNHPAVMIPALLLMSGMYGIFTLPLLVAATLWLLRLTRQGPDKD